MELNEYQDLARQTALYKNATSSKLMAEQLIKNLPSLSPEDREKFLSDFNTLYTSTFANFYTALGLNGEAGEVAEEVKKCIRDDGGILSPSRRERMAQELGDVLWYISLGAWDIGFQLEEIARMNINKLRERHLIKNETRANPM